MNPATSEAIDRPADAGANLIPILQLIKKIIIVIATVELLLSCQTERRKPPGIPAVPGVESFAPAPQLRPIKAGDPLLEGLDVDRDETWIANKGPARKYEPEIGRVSYYHEPQKLADGDRFDPSEMTAAHKHWPLHSIVRCTNLENGKSVVVVIKDRGPFEKGRILDLSRAAGHKIGLSKDGVERCRVELLAYPAKDKEAGKAK